jgi:hypothetical protein
MVCESCFASLSAGIEHRIGIDIKKVVVTPSSVHCNHSVLALFCGDNFTTIFENQCIRLEVSQCTQAKPPISSLQ